MLWIELTFLILALFDLQGAYSADPCTDYTAINDTKVTVAYMASGMDSLSCQTLPALKWYRYTGTANGRVTSTCPQDLQCGSKNQIWFNDSIPAETDGEIMKQICIHEGPLCCPKSNKIHTKNCTDFIVYQYIPNQPNCTNYCYEAPEKSSSSKEGVMSSSTTTTPFLTTERGTSVSEKKNSLITTEGGRSSLDATTPLVTTVGGKSRSNSNAPSMWVWIILPISAFI